MNRREREQSLRELGYGFDEPGFQPWRGQEVYLLTYSTEQSPCLEANRFSASEEITRILWSPNVHYRIRINRPIS